MKQLCSNGDFSIWSNKPASGVVVINEAGAAPYSLHDHWYGGPGPGGQIYYYGPAIPPNDTQRRRHARQYCFLNWTSGPTAGNPIDYPGAPRATYLEQNGCETPEYAADEVWTFSFDAWAWNCDPITVIPIIWLSMAQIGWLSGQPKVIGNYVTSTSSAGVFAVYQATTAGTTGSTIPSHTSGIASDGGVTWQYIGAAKGRSYEIYEGGPKAHAGTPYVATGTPNDGAAVTVNSTPKRYSVDIALPKLGQGAMLPPEDNRAMGGVQAFAGLGFDIYGLPASGTCFGLHNVEVRNDGCNRFHETRRKIGEVLGAGIY